MLQGLARDLAARSSSILQAERHANLSTLFDNILESVPQAVIAIAGDDRVIACNSNAEFLFGIQRIFVMDEPYFETFPEQLSETFKNLIAQSLLGKEIADAEIELELQAGVSINVGISINYLRDRAGQAQGHLFLCRDLSLSREVQKLRELDQMKSEFVNTVSHELKTPLTAILGGVEILEMEAEAMDEDTKEIVDVIGDGAKRLRDLIFDLLDVSRFETGKVALREELTSVRNVIEESLRVQHPTNKHTIKVEIDETIPEIVMDRGKIIQCVTNYVSNAIKYSPKGGEILVTATKDDEKRMVIVGVKDQGLGLSPQNVKKVWEKFYRVDASYTADIEGTGLGLVIVKMIVELHGGSVWIDSNLGRGSTFYLSLPVKQQIDDSRDD